MSENLPPLSEGFSSDGYIVDQDCFSSVRYRCMRADINGCGWIAAYNLRHFLGQTDDWNGVRLEMDGMHTLRIPGPTLMRVMREYLDRHVPGWTETSGRNDALEAAERSQAGIIRYTEGHEPHFISYIRADDSHFRFFNVADGLEDCIMTMSRFAEEHLLRGQVTVFTV